jgi:hypothetical protein
MKSSTANHTHVLARSTCIPPQYLSSFRTYIYFVSWTPAHPCPCVCAQVAAQELQLDQLRRPPLHSAPDSVKETKLGAVRRSVDHLSGTFGFGALDEVPLGSSYQSVLRSSMGSSDVLLDTMSEYSQEYHLTDQAIADMLHSVGSPDRRSVGSPDRRRGVNGVGAGGGRKVSKSHHKARLSVDSILSRKSLFKDASVAGKGEEGANKKRRWI